MRHVSQQNVRHMVYASLVHVETGVEYHQNDMLIFPSPDQKLLWLVCGLPDGVTRLEETFETEIDEFTGRSKSEIERRVQQNFKDGKYSFLPPLGVNQSVELRYARTRKSLEEKQSSI